MQIGVMIGGTSQLVGLEGLVTRAKELESRGFPTMWIPHVFGLDPITAAAAIGRETDRIELGTAVVPTYPRHPTTLAQQALTAGIACQGRFTLGIGLSHPAVIEGMWACPTPLAQLICASTWLCSARCCTRNP